MSTSSFTIDSNIMPLRISLKDDKICDVTFIKQYTEQKPNKQHIPIYDALKNYFLGNKVEFDFKYFLCGTSFQIEVWNEISKVKYGKTITYKEIAQNIGRPKAYRAVGTTTGKNPIPILIP